MKLFSIFSRRTPKPTDGRFDKLREAMEAKAHSFIERRLNVPLHKFGDYSSYIAAGSKKVWATFHALDIIANTVLGATFRITEQAGGAGTAEEVNDPDLAQLLLTPNPYDSLEEMLYQWTFHLKLTGNAYWLKDEINARGQPLHLYPLLPQHVVVTPDARSKVSGYEYKVNGNSLKFAPEEVIHFRRPHPSDCILGIGDVEPSESLFNEFINRKTLEEKFIENGATPSGVMTRKDADDMDASDWEKLKKKWVSDYGGKDNAGKTMFMGGDWTYEKLGLTHTEMQSIEKERLGVEQIFTNHGVPLSLAGVKDAANYATARQDEINFRKYVVVPLLNLLVGKLNTGQSLMRAFNPKWSIGFGLAGLIDVEQVWRDYGQLYLNGGMTPNEMRQQMGLDKLNDPLMDMVYQPSGRVPMELSSAGSETEADGTPSTSALEQLEQLALEGQRANGNGHRSRV